MRYIFICICILIPGRIRARVKIPGRGVNLLLSMAVMIPLPARWVLIPIRYGAGKVKVFNIRGPVEHMFYFV